MTDLQSDQPTADLAIAPLPDDGSDRASIERTLDQFQVMYPFPLDAFQRDAISTLLRGDSVMVAAPTGSGKTVVAEFGVWDAFRRTTRVIYTAPIKALSNQKFRDLRAIYGDNVGLLTGDVTENHDAQIIVMTTEILRNMLLQSPWELDDVETVIFDEIHYLADPERGTTWEESIILCPEHIQLICLSATVTNASEISGWISRTHRPIRLITHHQRPVPLALYYFYEGKLTKVIDHHGQQVADFGKVGGEARRRRGEPRAPGSRLREAADEPQPFEIIDALHENELLPAIYFLFSRNDCQVFAERLAVVRPSLVGEARAAQIESVLQTYLQTMRPEDQDLAQVTSVMTLARKGIGYHHAGLLPILKQLVEVLFSRGLMEVVFATDTLALGVNMPARTVVIGRMSKWDGRRRRVLIPNEFQQMAGRAGRRGMDAYGHVVMPYSPVISFRDAMEVASGELHPVQSAFAIRYNTVLNLWDPPRGERVRQMLQRSLAQYQTSQRIRVLEQDVLEIEAQLIGMTAGQSEHLAQLDELYEEYQSFNRQTSVLERQAKDLQDSITALWQEVEKSTPWPEPGRLGLRKLLKASAPGLVVHTRNHGWAAFLGRIAETGIGQFVPANGDEIVTLDEYRQIDFVDAEHRISLEGFTDGMPDGDVPEEHLRSLLEFVHAELTALNLPDLDEVARAHRALMREQADPEIHAMQTQLLEIREQLAAIREQKATHPFRDVRLRKQHQLSVKHRDALHKEKNLLTDILAREVDAEDVRIRAIIRGIRDVLHRFGYMQRGYPTEKADMLADVFDNDGLIICEMIDHGLLNALQPEEIAEVFSWFSFDRDFRYANGFVLPRRLEVVRRRLEDIEQDAIGEERDHKLYISEGHNPTFFGPALHWCRGWTMAQISEQIELSEGDLVMTFNKTIDLMRQFRDMLMNIDEQHPLHQKLRQAERLIRRGIVEQSLSLGFAQIADEEAGDDESPEPDEGEPTEADVTEL